MLLTSCAACVAMALAASEPIERIQITTSVPQTAAEIPAAVSNLSTDAQLPGLRIDAAELLQGIAGVQSDSRANYAQDTRITLRGFGARSAFGVRGVLLRLDGVPLSMPDGQAQTSSILLDEPDNVQVIRGPLAAIYGNASGGVIDWRSRTPTATATEVKAMVGANQTYRTLVQQDWVGTDNAVRLVGAHFETDGPRPHNSAQRSQLAARWYHQLTDNTEVVVRLDNNLAPLLQDPSSLTPNAWRENPEQTVERAFTYNTRKRIHHRQVSASLRYAQQGTAADVSVWRGWRDVEQYLPFTGDDLNGSGAVIDLRRQFVGMDASYDHDLTKTVRLSHGVQVAQQQDRRFGYVNDFGNRGEVRRNENGTVDTQSAYTLAQWSPTTQFNLYAGGRFNQVEFAVNDFYIAPQNPDDSGRNSLSEWSWMAGLNYQFSDTWSAFIARGHGFETPTLTELAYRNDGSGLNPDLGAATNQQWEAGLKWQFATGQATVTAFQIDTNNEIVVDQSNNGRTTYTNAEQTKRRGLELSVDAALHETLQVRGSATYLKAEYSNGLRLPGVAKQQAYLQANWQALSNTQLSLAMDYRGDIAAFDDNSVFAPSHTLLHLSVAHETQWHGWAIAPWVKIHNLTDRDYVGSVVVNQGSGRSFEPGVGRELKAGVQFRYLW